MRPHSSLQTLHEVVSLLWAVADRYVKRRLLVALLLVAGGALLAALAPIALKFAVDALTADGQATALLGPLAFVTLYVVGEYVLRTFSEVCVLVFGEADQRVRRHVSRRLFEHVVHLPMRFHLERKTGAIGQMVEQGMQGYDLLLNHIVYTVAPVVIEFLAVVFVLVHFGHQPILVIFVAAAVAYVVAFRRGASDIWGPATKVSSAYIDAHAVLTDSLLNYETVKYFDAEPLVCKRYDQILGRTESAWHLFFRRRVINGLVVATIFAFSLGASLLYAGHGVLRGTMTAGDFVLINAYVLRIVQPLEMLGLAIRDIAQGLAFLKSLLELFRERTEVSDGAPLLQEGWSVDTADLQAPRQSDMRRPAAVIGGELTFENVTFSYRPDQSVLTDVNFRVPGGHTVAVVGVSGSGKSSLIRLLFRLYEPDGGRILLDGLPIAQMPLSAVRQAIAVVPQDTVLFHDTLEKNIALGRPGASRLEIEDAARLAKLHDLVMGWPDGYETIVGERGLKLSGGERQRVAIARAALKRPRVFVFDEATSSLDSSTEREILRHLADVSSRSTTLVIAHRLSTIVHADEILVLDKGMIVERGTHAKLLEHNGHYATLWRAQHGGSSGRDEFATTAA